MRAAPRTTEADSRRARLVKLIHVARRELERAGQMDEPTYRAMLRTASKGRAESSTDLTLPELEAALQACKRAGFKVQGKAAPARAGARRQDMRPQARKVRALWLFLHVLGLVRNPSEEALAAYVRRIARVDDLHWADDALMDLLIETMKKWAMRTLPTEVKRQIAMARARGNLDEDQRRAFGCALAYLDRGEGFDLHWWAWAQLCDVLGQPVPGDIAASGVAGEKP